MAGGSWRMFLRPGQSSPVAVVVSGGILRSGVSGIPEEGRGPIGAKQDVKPVARPIRARPGEPGPANRFTGCSPAPLTQPPGLDENKAACGSQTVRSICAGLGDE